MKIIDYENTRGSFKIEYLDDHEIIEGTINIDDNSLNLDALITKQIINNKVNDIIEIKEENNIKFKIIEKNISIQYKEINEYDFFESFKLYNEVMLGIESEYVNVSDNVNTSNNNILFQFYYKNEESDERDTASYILKNYFKKGWRVSDSVSPEGYYKEYELLSKCFKSNFLAKIGANINDFYYCSVPKGSREENSNLDALVYEITKRDIRHNVNNYFINSDINAIKSKNIILIDDIQFNSSDIVKYRNKLFEDGANSVIIYTFS